MNINNNKGNIEINSKLKNKEDNSLNNDENMENNEIWINQNNSLISNNNTDSNEMQSKLFKNIIIIINKNKSSSLILSNLNRGNNSVKIGKGPINIYMKNNGNINSTWSFNYNFEYKTLFIKLN